MDKTMIFAHLAIYTLIILATLGMCYFGANSTKYPEKFVIMEIVQSVVYLISELLLGLIINTICSRVVNSTIDDGKNQDDDD